jgi:hypothetical protein
MSAIREIYDKLFSPFEIQMLKTGMLEDKILEFGRLCKNHIKQEKISENSFELLRNQIEEIREKRIEKWDESWKNKILSSPKVISYEDNVTKIELHINLNEEITVIDYYPKANKVLIRKNNEWKSKGLNWLIKNLLE